MSGHSEATSDSPVSGRISVGIGVITRRRSAKLADLLDSFRRMMVPDWSDPVFLIVENDAAQVSAAAVEGFRAAMAAPVVYALETDPGIPIARNRVLEMAMARKLDYLTFVDDDERVTEEWLIALLSGMRAHDLDLGGGPVHIVPPPVPLSPWNQAILEFVTVRMKKRNCERGAFPEAGLNSDLRVYTYNWCVRLSKVAEAGLRFDPALRYSGGSDTRFSIDMRAAGGRVGWIPTAVVEEPTPKARLTLGYLYSRARDQATNSVQIRGFDDPFSLTHEIKRSIDSCLAMLTLPVAGRKAVVKSVFKLGVSVGRIRAAYGNGSRHYAPGSEKVHNEH